MASFTNDREAENNMRQLNRLHFVGFLKYWAFALAISTFLVRCSERTPDFLQVPPAEANSLKAPGGNAIRSRLESWVNDWSPNTFSVSEARLKELLAHEVSAINEPGGMVVSYQFRQRCRVA